MIGLGPRLPALSIPFVAQYDMLYLMCIMFLRFRIWKLIWLWYPQPGVEITERVVLCTHGLFVETTMQLMLQTRP